MPALRVVVLCCLLGVSVSLPQGHAQAVAGKPAALPPPYSPQVWDIDWSGLRDPKMRQEWTDRLHWIPIGSSGDRTLSVTGQIRERGEYQDHPAFGAQPPDNGYLLQRYLLSGDLHLGTHVRTFIQLDSGLIDGRDGGPRPGIDRDQLDFNQGFADVTLGTHGSNRNLTVRAGRQLVSLGSTRLVAIGAGLNVEQPFDGVRVTLQMAGWTAQGLALRPTLIETGTFDNRPNSAEELWGLYLTHSLHRLQSNVDLYYLGFDHKQARYTQGTGREQRETLGARVWSHTSTWDYDFEYTGQFGRFHTGDIRPGPQATISVTHSPAPVLRRTSRSTAASSAGITIAQITPSVPSTRSSPTGTTLARASCWGLTT